MTTPNQQPEVSAEAQEAAPDTITHYILLIQGVPKEFIELKDFNRTTEKLREELAEWKQAAEIEAKCHDETNARCDQLRAELTAQKQCTEAEHRSFEIMSEQWEKLNDETRVLRAENEALLKDREIVDFYEEHFDEVEIRLLTGNALWRWGGKFVGCTFRGLSENAMKERAAMAKGEAK